MMYSNDKVILEYLTKNDAPFLYEVYSHPELSVNFDESPFLLHETPEEFTERIISLCEYVFTIRLTAKPALIIGDCALHHWNKQAKEITIGGSLLPEYWGKGFMRAAFELLTEIAKQELGVKTLLGVTKIRNIKAIRLVEKMGFVKHQINHQDIIMKKQI